MSQFNGDFKLKDAGFNIGVNVRVRRISKRTGEIIQEVQGHNRCLKQQLMGITKFLNGEFNPTQSYLVSFDWIPRYLAVGTNESQGETPGITTKVNINDTRLLNEISPRVKLPERNTVINNSKQNYVQLSINTYLPEGWYAGQKIREAGLFSKETGNNCLFRITFEEIPITVDSIVEISWIISVISVESNNQPYVESDKEDLVNKIDEMMTRFTQLFPDLRGCCDSVINTGIPVLMDQRATQEQINEAVGILDEEIRKIADLDPHREVREATALVNEINGENI